MKIDLKKIQNYELQILEIFHETCEILNVQYSLSGGTLLGAIRHNGFIPWDDDIDVIMRREDYDKFIRECSSYLPSNYFMQTHLTDKNYPLSFGKLRDTNIKLSVQEVKNIEMQIGVCIDVFPVDKCSNYFFVDWYDRIRLSIVMFLKYSILEEKNENKKIIRYLVKRISKLIIKKIGTYNLNLIEDNIRKCRNKQKNRYTYADNQIPAYKWKKAMRQEWRTFESMVLLNFENKKFMSISNYDSYLSNTYGDYMKLPPIEERKPTHNFVKV